MGRTGPSLTIDSVVLYTMLVDPEFFRRVPAYFFMKPAATELHRRMTGDASNGSSNCTGCGTPLSKAIRPLRHVFINHTRAMVDECPAGLEPLVAYITDKRGYRPRQILLYYQDGDGTTHTIAL